MTINTSHTDTSNNPPKPSNRPAYEALMPVTDENGATTWQKIGAAWTAKNGFNLVLTELPFTPDGKQTIYLRAPRQNRGHNE